MIYTFALEALLSQPIPSSFYVESRIEENGEILEQKCILVQCQRRFTAFRRGVKHLCSSIQSRAMAHHLQVWGKTFDF